MVGDIPGILITIYEKWFRNSVYIRLINKMF